MRVAFDDQIFSSAAKGGVARYFVELMRHFQADRTLGVDLVGPRKVWSRNDYSIQAGFGRRLPDFRGAGKVIRLANRLRPISRNAEILHHTYYAGSYLNRYGRRADPIRVVTVYDMIPERFPALFPRGNPHGDKRRFVDEADLIFCISKATRDDLLDIYGTPKAPIVITPLGVGEVFAPDLMRPSSLPKRYMLFVGKRGAYKDFTVLAEAFALLTGFDEIQLVAIGGGPFSAAEQAGLQRLRIADRTIQLAADDATLAGAYANAECFVFPSRYEGFGLPTIEAMASGCPTILASSSSHLEVGDDAALFFPPGDPTELASVMNRLLGDVQLGDLHVERGLLRAKSFTWGRTAQLTADAYRNALEDR